MVQTFSLHLLAAPVREIWFSTPKPFVSANGSAPTNQISAGDILSSRGRVVKRNRDLVSQLGVMPVASDLGLDAFQVMSRGEILFSLPRTVFSESLGRIQHGHLLSSRGTIIKRNQDLLAAFHPASTTDAGLDAFHVMPDGQILFSIQSNVTISSTLTLSRGDILSDRGQVFMAHERLMANFQPAVTNHDFGLDAFWPLPSGEILFSTEEDFVDNRIGTVRAGDLLSSLGNRVFSNQDLVAAFAPSDPSLDYGLDGLFVITDLQPSRTPPRIVKQTRSGGVRHFEWDGDGSVFQLERAENLFGPWTPFTDIIPDLSWDATDDSTTGAFGFFRLRQW
jgi:hypothetical protein